MTTRPNNEEGGNGHGRPPRDPALAEAEAQVIEARERVAESMMALRQEVARRTDWRSWIRERPATVLGAAFALGLLLGLRSGRSGARR
jgi:ElaB/YqjD/DUF883 family membrane-anchored ribosome-binding protein